MSVLTNHFLSIWLCFYTCMLWYVIIWLALLWSHYFLPTCVLHIQWEFFSDLAVVTGSVKSKLRHLLQYFFWHICNSSKTCSQVRYLSSHQCRHLYDPRLFCPKYTTNPKTLKLYSDLDKRKVFFCLLKLATGLCILKIDYYTVWICKLVAGS